MAPAPPFSSGSPAAEAPRTRTGLLEGYLARARDAEALARARLAAVDPPAGEERKITLTVLQHAVGLERALERWIAWRVRPSS